MDGPAVAVSSQILHCQRALNLVVRYDVLCEWARSDTASAVSKFESYVAACIERYACSISSSNISTVSRQTSFTAIEEWMFSWIFRSSPVPVRLVPVVTTFIAKGLLVRPNIIPMPNEKVALCILVSLHGCGSVTSYREVNSPRLLNMCHHEVIVSTFRTSGNRCRCSCWLLAQAKYSVDTVVSFRSGKVAPVHGERYFQKRKNYTHHSRRTAAFCSMHVSALVCPLVAN